jgi:hypothetical protein
VAIALDCSVRAQVSRVDHFDHRLLTNSVLELARLDAADKRH